MKEDIIRMAREAGFYDGEIGRAEDAFERFAALVLAKHPPQSSMAWQEGFEAGRLAEREACAKVCEEVERQATRQPPMVGQGCQACAAAIRARGQA